MARYKLQDPIYHLLNEEGYVVLPLIDQSTVDKLLQAYHETSPSGMMGFHPTLSWEDPALKARLSQQICSLLSGYIQQHVPGYRLLYGSFMVKEPDGQSGMKLHQDWAYVDEREGVSLAIWLPLMDLDESNGALHVIPRSHIFPNYIRGPGVFCPFEEQSQYISRHFSQPLYLKKGQPVIWNHRLLHHSPPNRSMVPRIAATIILVPEGMEVLHYFKPEENDRVSEFFVSEGFYFNYDIGKKPDKLVTLRREFQHREQSYSEKQLAGVLGRRGGFKSFLRKLFRH